MARGRDPSRGAALSDIRSEARSSPERRRRRAYRCTTGCRDRPGSTAPRRCRGVHRRPRSTRSGRKVLRNAGGLAAGDVRTGEGRGAESPPHRGQARLWHGRGTGMGSPADAQAPFREERVSAPPRRRVLPPTGAGHRPTFHEAADAARCRPRGSGRSSGTIPPSAIDDDPFGSAGRGHGRRYPPCRRRTRLLAD